MRKLLPTTRPALRGAPLHPRRLLGAVLAATTLLVQGGCDSGTLAIDHERRRPEPISGGATSSLARLGIQSLLNRPGETAPPVAAAGAGAAPAQRLHGNLPAGWTQLPPAQFRDFQVSGPDGIIAYVTLLGRGNDLASNITRWQRRLGLPTEAVDAAGLPTTPLLGATGRIIELRGRWSDVNNTTTIPDARLLAIYADLPGEAGTATFLAVGPSAAMEAQRAGILALAADIAWKDAP